MNERRKRGIFLVFLSITLVFGFAGLAQAANATAPLTFVIGVPGRTGCLVCHGDPKILSVKKMKESLYVNANVVNSSVHKDVACTSCHSDFALLSATQDHGKVAESFRLTAGLACKNCHKHVDQLKAYAQSIHGRIALGADKGKPGKPAPTCADCHGSHQIKSLKKDKDYARSFRLSGIEMCGKCHKDYVDSYNDYYHGRAYKAKALDAPTCWDCHGAHQIEPKKSGASLVNPRRLAKTCGKCHIDSKDAFSQQFGPMIHGTSKIMENNFVLFYAAKAVTLAQSVIDTLSGYYHSVTSAMFSRER